MVSIVTKLWSGKSSITTLEWAEGFSLLQHVQISSAVNPASYSVGTRRTSTSSKATAVLRLYICLSGAEVKNTCRYIKFLTCFMACTEVTSLFFTYYLHFICQSEIAQSSNLARYSRYH
jgi:hypothetical protein